jgi:hypothetical protein
MVRRFAIKLRSRLAATTSNDATHAAKHITLSHVATGNEMPMPVARATYAATHAGHLGSSASAMLGTIQPAISLPRQNRDAGR